MPRPARKPNADPVLSANGRLGFAVLSGDVDAERAARLDLARAKADRLRAKADALVAAATAEYGEPADR